MGDDWTLRDWFAGIAMQALKPNYSEHEDQTLARRAYAIADAMLAQQKKEGE